MIKIASLQYKYDFPPNFESYQQKISHQVEHHARLGVDLLVFPEYAGLEMLSFVALEELPDYIPQYLKLFQELSQQYQIYICSGTQVVTTDEGTFNRSYLFSPSKKVGYQDKCMLTPYEIDEGILDRGKMLRLFDTKLGKIAICICYDVEFPSLVRKVIDAGAKLILVPSYTSSIHGYYRVWLSCRARALENQCYVVQSALVGQTDIEMAYGASAICSPIDQNFPEDGLLKLGRIDQPDSVIEELDLSQLEKARSEGETRNYMDAKAFNHHSLSLKSSDLI